MSRDIGHSSSSVSSHLPPHLLRQSFDLEAAESLGLDYYHKMRLVILPQALKIVIPPTVGVLISAFKDTSLVVIIALYDILNTTKSILTEPEWTGFSTEAYFFVALIYYIFCFSMSQYSRRIEKDLEYRTDTAN